MKFTAVMEHCFSLLAAKRQMFVDFSRRTQTGPGEKSIQSLHARIGTSKYMPHQGEQECARRKRQMEKRND